MSLTRECAAGGLSPRRVAVSWSLALALLVVLSGCGIASGSDSDRVLRLQDPGNQGVMAYAKKTGILEERLAAVDTKVEWGGSYASFTATIDAVRSGDVNVLQGAISPAVGYLSTSEDLKIFAVSPRPKDPAAPAEDGLVVPAGSDIASVKDLVGKKIAVNQGGRGEYLLNVALDEAGIEHDQVEKVYLNPDEGAGAFASGKVDAWWAIVRGYPLAVANGAKTLITSADVADEDLTISAARREVAELNPEALKVYAEVYAELTVEANADPAKFQNVFTDSGPTATSGVLLEHDTELQRYSVPPALVSDADVEQIAAVADYFFKNQMISKPVDAESAVVRLDP